MYRSTQSTKSLRETSCLPAGMPRYAIVSMNRAELFGGRPTTIEAGTFAHTSAPSSKRSPDSFLAEESRNCTTSSLKRRTQSVQLVQPVEPAVFLGDAFRAASGAADWWRRRESNP